MNAVSETALAVRGWPLLLKNPIPAPTADPGEAPVRFSGRAYEH